MSILVEGMVLPKNCDECPLFTDDGDYNVCYIGKKCIPWEWADETGIVQIHQKPRWCPLVRVSPHAKVVEPPRFVSEVCSECRHCKEEEITNGLYGFYCVEGMESFGTKEGCYQFWRKEEDERKE